ncbi:hypothetical protein GCM10022226_81070 [Sphaerisporangium flaviroseum]|uniref:CsbD family protein n=1 Tax=Sphaerisporangium flaviroseum TaxID=509199 RepID=A0ABP7JJ13_9ACTN
MAHCQSMSTHETGGIMAGTRKKTTKATGKAKKAAIKATRETKQNKAGDEDKRNAESNETQ